MLPSWSDVLRRLRQAYQKTQPERFFAKTGLAVYLLLVAAFVINAPLQGHVTESPAPYAAFRSFEIAALDPTATPRTWIASWAGPTDNIEHVYVPPSTPKPTQKAWATHKPQPRLAGGPYKPWRTFSANVTAARLYAASVLSRTSFRCLDVLADRESGWRVHAENKSSGAYGIPQALPGRKMASIADDWRDNATTQIRWMIRYVKGRYGNPCIALDHSYRTSWY